MMDWIHCNHCYTQIKEPKIAKFYVTSCGHLFCDLCKNNISICSVCNRKFTAAALDETLSEDTKVYFLDPEKGIRKQVEIMEFQRSQRVHLNKYLLMKCAKYDNLKEECIRHRDEKNKLKDTLIEKYHEIQKLKQEIGTLRSQSTICASRNKNFSSVFQDSLRSYGSQNTFNLETPPSSSQSMNLPIKTSMAGVSPLGAKENLFTPPQPVSLQNIHRSCKSNSSQTLTSSSILSPNTSQNTQAGSAPRKILFPGDRGSSPSTKLGINRLTLKSGTPSTMRLGPSPVVKVVNRVGRPLGRNLSASKYNKYY